MWDSYTGVSWISQFLDGVMWVFPHALALLL